MLDSVQDLKIHYENLLYMLSRKNISTKHCTCGTYLNDSLGLCQVIIDLSQVFNGSLIDGVNPSDYCFM